MGTPRERTPGVSPEEATKGSPEMSSVTSPEEISGKSSEGSPDVPLEGLLELPLEGSSEKLQMHLGRDLRRTLRRESPTAGLERFLPRCPSEEGPDKSPLNFDSPIPPDITLLTRCYHHWGTQLYPLI